MRVVDISAEPRRIDAVKGLWLTASVSAALVGVAGSLVLASATDGGMEYLLETYLVKDPSAPNGQRQQTWLYPSRADCTVCHTPERGRVLGVRTRQLARPTDVAEPPAGSLRWLADRDLFASPPDPAVPYDVYADESIPKSLLYGFEEGSGMSTF